MGIHIEVAAGTPPESEAYHLVRRLGALANTVNAISGPQDETEPSVNVVFHLGGAPQKPGGSGLRTSRFSRKHQRVEVKVSIPLEMTEVAALETFAFESLRQACEVARSFFHVRGLELDVERHKRMVKALEDLYRSVGKSM